jgi:thiamine pyrophosphokinase
MIAEILPKIIDDLPTHIIIANGRFPTSKFILNILQQAQMIVWCDGAIRNINTHPNLKVNYIVGDIDSLDAHYKNKFQHLLIIDHNQHTNDLTKAINFAINNLKWQKVLIIGGTGLREDHSIANIGLLYNYSQQLSNIYILSEHGIFSAHTTNTIVKTLPHQQISLFTLSPTTKLTTKGLKWELNDMTFDNWNQGTLNQALSTEISLECSQPVIIYRAFELKK